MERLLNWHTKYQKEEIGIEPISPRVNFGEAIKYLYEIIDNYSSVKFVDKVFYRIAL